MNEESKNSSENSKSTSNSVQSKSCEILQNSETNLCPLTSQNNSKTNYEYKLQTKIPGRDTFSQEKREIKNPKTFLKSSTEVEPLTAENVVVGDDLNKKDEICILCECEPNVSGAAVPTITSFIATNSNISLNETYSKSTTHTFENKNNESDFNKCSDEKKASQTQKSSNENIKMDIDQEKTLRDVNKNMTSVTKGQPTKESKCKRQSFIPKLTRPNSTNQKSRNMVKNEREDQQNVREHLKLAMSRNISNSASSKLNILKSQFNKNELKPLNINSKKSVPCVSSEDSICDTISSRMLGLQERLKATTSMLRHKIDIDKSKEVLSQENHKKDKTENNKNGSTKQVRNINDLHSNISQLKEIATSLSEVNSVKEQKKIIEKLLHNISEIKKIADKLGEYENGSNNDEPLNETVDTKVVNSTQEEREKIKNGSTKIRDNKIYIKFFPSKDHHDKKKRKETMPGQSEEIQTELALGSMLTSERLNSTTRLVDKGKEENITESDSLDGIFIPSVEPPCNIEEEDESNGLDITITFPEFNQLRNKETDSHLSVRLSDISEEALRKLKRCPKDFTLRMDFVQGKVLFQSGKGPANNFLIGPDLKFTENIVDVKKSDIISIKRSTECSYGSQLIPVENTANSNSYKSLKSTDSELFNVVNLPFTYKSPCVNATTKSCLTFKSDNFISMAIIARHFFKSMPQIPSLTNIFEEELNENFDTAFQIQEKKRKNRQNQKKKINSNTTL